MLKRIIIFSTVLVTIFGLPIVSIAYAGVPGRGKATSRPSDLGYVPGELLVRFAPKTNGAQRSKAEKTQILEVLGAASVVEDYRLVPGLSHVKLPAGITVEQAMARLNKRPDIIYAQPNHYLMLCSIPNDQRFGDLWGMHNIGQMVCQTGTSDADIDAPEAWDIKTDASAVIVAVIDSGVDYTHDDLSANMWINPGEDHEPFGEVTLEDYDGVNDDGNYDPDGNPLIDDLYGYDFCRIGGKERDNDPKDDDLLGGHGTHIAGTIGARGNNGVGVTGVCWEVKIMALRLFLNNTDFGFESDAIACIGYAVDKGAKVISASWGRYRRGPRMDLRPGRGPYTAALRDAIENAGKNGVLFVAAANNFGDNIDDVESGYPFDPASYDLDNIISVMATDEDDMRAVWDPPYSSNYGAVSVDLAAPGTCILSCWPWHVEEENGKYLKGQGTSMSTPHVSGACALIWAINPTLSHLEVKGIILSTVDVKSNLEDDPDPLIGRTCVTGGRLNLGRAAEVASDYAPVFSVKDTEGERVAWFDNVGNVFVKGRLSQGPGTGQEMKGHWKFDETEGSTAHDFVGTNHGTLNNFPQDDSQWVTGKINGALEFDGADDYVSLSPIAALQGSTVTVTAWIKTDDTSEQDRPILTQYDQTHVGYRLLLKSRKPCFIFNGDLNGAQASDPIGLNEWHHLAGTYDNEQLRIYVDGHLEDTYGQTFYYFNALTANIGYGDQSPYPHFKGIIDDVRAYNYAMGAAEIWDFVFPNSSRFRVCNSSDETVSWFDDCGYGWLKGAIHERQSSLDPASNETDDFVVKNTENDVVAFISDSGDLYLKGSLYEYEE